MKKFYHSMAFVTVFFLITGFSNAQSFIRNYLPSSGTSTLNYYTYVLPTTDGNYLACGQMKESGGATTDMLITLFNENGEEIWSRKQGDADEPEGALYAIEIAGNYYVMGWTNNSGANYNEILILALNSSGNLLPGWPKQYQASGSTNHKFCYRLFHLGNKIIVSGSTSSGGFDNLLFAIDLNGNIVWDRTYNVIGNDKGGYDLIQLQNNNLLSSGHLYDGSYDLQFMFTDTVGNVMDLYRYNCTGQDLYAAQVIDLGTSNGIIAVGNYNSGLSRDIFAMKINYAGDVQWATRYGINSQDDYAGDAVLLDDGSIGIAGYTKNPGSSNSSSCGLFMRINSSGSILSQFGYQPTNTANENYKFYGLSKNNAGDVVISGLGVSPNSGSDGMILMVMDPAGLAEGCGQIQVSLAPLTVSVVKTEPAASPGVGFGIGASASTLSTETITEDEACGSFIGIEENHSSVPVLVYPNPATDVIQMNIPYSDVDGSFELLNMEGKIVRNGTIHSEQLIVNIQDLACGVYLVKLRINNTVFHAKLIKN